MIEHTPLDVMKLSAAAQKALGAGPGRMMASRGLVPLPPVDQLAVLYQLAIDGEQALATAARTTVMGLPDKLLATALGEGALDPRVLDLFAVLVGEKPAAFEALVGNPSIDDHTIAYLAESCGPAEVDRIATNEQRLLRHPEIIAAMYQNAAARMSTVDRVVELAVRNNVRVPGLAAWDEIARALQSAPAAAPESDELFEAALAAGTGEPDKPAEADGEAEPQKKVPIERLSVKAKLRLASIGDGFARSILVRDPLRAVSLAAIKSPKVTEFEAARYAGNQSLSEDVIKYIASRREWTKLPGTRTSLCRNPKTPVAEVIRLLPLLNERDLSTVAASKGVSSAVVAQAKKMIANRRGGGDKK